MTLAFALTLVPTLILQGAGRSIPPLIGAGAKVLVLATLIYWVIPVTGLGPVYVFAAATISYLLEGGIDTWQLIRFLRALPRPLTSPAEVGVAPSPLS